MTEIPVATGRRTSPLIVLVHTATFRQARSFVPAGLGLGAAVGVNSGTSAVVAMVVAVTLVSLGTAALSWWRFGYTDGPTAVVVTRGLLSRSVRTVPKDRIRGVEVEAPALHRLFGLVRVRIDAAAGAVSGKEEELVVDGVPRAEGDRLRTVLLTRRAAPAAGATAAEAAPEAAPGTAPGTAPGAASGTVAGAAPEDEAAEEFARFDNRWLLYAPLVGSYLLLPLAAVGALFRLADELPDGLKPTLPGPDAVDGAAVAIALAAALAVLVIGAVVGAAVVNWGFRLVRRGGSLLAVRGLVTRRHTALEIDRIRGVALVEGLGMRLVRAARVSALVTGLGDAARRGQLLPLGPRDAALTLTHRLVEDPGPLARHPAAARRRRLVRAVAPGVLVAVAGAVATAAAGWWWPLLAGGVLAVLGIPLGLGRYAALGSVAGPSSFSVRAGWLAREQAVLQRRAVVGWRVRQSFFQRRAGLATVVACVGAGGGGYAAVDLAAEEAAAFAQAASGPWAATLSD